MAIIKPFRGFRPDKGLVKYIASRPYDVLSSDEAREEVKDNPNSFLHVVKPEVDLPGDIDVHSMPVYIRGKENLDRLIREGIFKQDEPDCYYVYAQTMNNKTQYGICACASIEDYSNGVIRKHELTRPDKEEDRINHIKTTNFNCEPVFFAFPDHPEIDRIILETVSAEPEYDFILDDGVGHHFWIISERERVDAITRFFKEDIPYTYVADGHHRTAAAADVGLWRKSINPQHTGNEEYNFFMAVHFPAGQLSIIDYNRLVTDLNSYSNEEFLEAIRKRFVVEEKGTETYKPDRYHNFSMYLDGVWYSLTPHTGCIDNEDPIGCLDVTILSELILEPLLNIKDLRKSNRIDFVGGIRGLEELKRRVDSGEMKAAFALYPVSMAQLIRIADTGNIMPPKTTWFEPKLRSGLVIHSLE